MDASEKADFKYAWHSQLSYVTDKTKIGLKKFKGDDNQVRNCCDLRQALLFNVHGQLSTLRRVGDQRRVLVVQFNPRAHGSLRSISTLIIVISACCTHRACCIPSKHTNQNPAPLALGVQQNAGNSTCDAVNQKQFRLCSAEPLPFTVFTCWLYSLCGVKPPAPVVKRAHP